MISAILFGLAVVIVLIEVWVDIYKDGPAWYDWRPPE